jgi:pyridoxal phosphate enzyme (YggS family)
LQKTDKYKELYERLDKLFEDVKKYATADVTVCAATKTVSAEVINRAAEHGLTDIGENRVQELLEKYPDLDKEKLNIHFIGRLQTNKVKYIVDKVCMIQSVDSERLAREIDKQCKKIGKKMPVLAEVNIGGEESKGGTNIEGLYGLCDTIMSLDALELRGIMIIPPKTDDKDMLLEYFSQSYEIFIDICKNKLHNIYNGVLSMGMSGDYIEAMQKGSTMIRPGRAIFGERYYPKENQDQ